jgi:hypothetical protein
MTHIVVAVRSTLFSPFRGLDIGVRHTFMLFQLYSPQGAEAALSELISKQLDMTSTIACMIYRDRFNPDLRRSVSAAIAAVP